MASWCSGAPPPASSSGWTARARPFEALRWSTAPGKPPDPPFVDHRDLAVGSESIWVLEADPFRLRAVGSSVVLATFPAWMDSPELAFRRGAHTTMF